MASRCQTAVYVLLMILKAIAWLLCLGGVGQLTNMCKDNKTASGENWITGCQDQFRWSWYIIFLQLIVFVGLIVALSRPQGVPTYRLVLVSFLVIVCTQTMLLADSYLSLWNACNGYYSKKSSTVTVTCSSQENTADMAAAAGFVLLTLVDWIWIIVCGAMDVESFSSRGGARNLDDLDKQDAMAGAERVNA